MSTNNSSLVGTSQKFVAYLTFGWMDYTLFFVMLSISAAVGVYFGFFSKKQDTKKEYLFGGKAMSYFPVAMSITAGHVSGITLLGIPSEVYKYGTQYAACIFTTIFMCILTLYIFLPVFHKLQLTSTFEYLELRFGRIVRQFASVLYTISLILHTPLVIYGPALAFAQVTGSDMHYVAPAIGGVCIFYTTVGGLKAVVWTDTIQFTVTIVTLFIVLTLGIISVGGIGEIWRISGEGGRLIFFDMNPSPFVRSSFWAVSLGLTTSWAANISVNQSSMQRFLAVPTLSEARVSLWVLCVGLVTAKWISVATGLIMFSKYHDCDPVTANIVDKADQMLPYYVMDVAGNIPGLPGLFISALVSSALSTMSGGLNTAAGTIWEDFISPWIPESEKKEAMATKVMKVTVVLLGFLCIFFVFVVEHLGDIFMVSTTMTGVTAGTITGFYVLGMMVPWANYKGAVIGGIIGFTASTWIIVGAQVEKVKDTYVSLPTSIANCAIQPNMTYSTESTSASPVDSEDKPMILYTISFLYYSLIGITVVVVSGTIASFVTGRSKLNELNRDHFAPIVQRFLPREKYTEVPLKPIPEVPDKEKEAM
ncbi:sodium-coupled monocarboxylate transporter 1-like [Neodiprion pinetum]|uniref:sodium-coupled monocarboxylate transporter 1-like n=1 Tax=Neodiprion pinetum TaxID=441929 RepID=UPI001EDE4EC4|nr:sodium-coupled monocarboxylate transporter 1-like [Neodiprion pinetum]